VWVYSTLYAAVDNHSAMLVQTYNKSSSVLHCVTSVVFCYDVVMSVKFSVSTENSRHGCLEKKWPTVSAHKQANS